MFGPREAFSETHQGCWGTGSRLPPRRRRSRAWDQLSREEASYTLSLVFSAPPLYTVAEINPLP